MSPRRQRRLSPSRIEIAALKTQLVHAREERDAAAAQASAQLQLATLARDEAAAAALRCVHNAVLHFAHCTQTRRSSDFGRAFLFFG